MSSEGQLWIWYHEVARSSSYSDGEMKLSPSAMPCSKECRVGSRINLLFSSLKTLRVEGLEILEEKAMGFFDEISTDEEEEEGENSCTEGSRSPERLWFAESKETEDMVNVKGWCELKGCTPKGQ